MALLPFDIDNLRSVLGTTLGEISAVVPIESGTTGHSYRIDTNVSRYVAKFFSPDSDVLLDPEAQFDLLTHLAATGIAPKPAAYDEDAGLLVTVYVDEAAAVSSNELRQPDRIRQIAGLLRRLHRANVELPRFDPESYASRYVSRLGGHARLSPRDRRRSDELIELAAELRFDGACPCHNDLTADNILFGREALLIDFDYAVLAPPILDLASVTVMNDFAPAQVTQLLAVYGDDARPPWTSVEFAKVQRLIRLLAHFWALASTDAEAAIVSQYRIEDV